MNLNFNSNLTADSVSVQLFNGGGKEEVSVLCQVFMSVSVFKMGKAKGAKGPFPPRLYAPPRSRCQTAVWVPNKG